MFLGAAQREQLPLGVACANALSAYAILESFFLLIAMTPEKEHHQIAPGDAMAVRCLGVTFEGSVLTESKA